MGLATLAPIHWSKTESMNTIERRKAVKEYKARNSCAKCGKIGNVREALLVRPDGTGIRISRLLSMSSLSDEALWEEISRRVVVCKRCFWQRRVEKGRGTVEEHERSPSTERDGRGNHGADRGGGGDRQAGGGVS